MLIHVFYFLSFIFFVSSFLLENLKKRYFGAEHMFMFKNIVIIEMVEYSFLILGWSFFFGGLSEAIWKG